MVSQRDWVSPPVFQPLQYRLADVVDGPHPYRGHQKLGVQFTPEACTLPLQTSTACLTGIGSAKQTTGSIPNRAADSFAVYTWLDCSPVGVEDGVNGLIRRTLEAHNRNAPTIVERVFWTGGDFNTSQHLAEDTAITEVVGGSTVNLQTAATVLVTGSVDVVEAIGRLEQAMAECYGGTPLIHVPRGATAHLAANHLVTAKGSRLVTTNGSIVVPAPGYTGSSPAGVAPAAGVYWFYATGSVKLLQSEPTPIAASPREFITRSVNDATYIIEQRFTLAWDCCHFAVPVSLGGTISGQFDSARGLTLVAP
jgi:hypothetical protein